MVIGIITAKTTTVTAKNGTGNIIESSLAREPDGNIEKVVTKDVEMFPPMKENNKDGQIKNISKFGSIENEV